MAGRPAAGVVRPKEEWVWACLPKSICPWCCATIDLQRPGRASLPRAASPASRHVPNEGGLLGEERFQEHPGFVPAGPAVREGVPELF